MTLQNNIQNSIQKNIQKNMDAHDVLTHVANKKVYSSQEYPIELSNILDMASVNQAQKEISKWPGYQATPLYDLQKLASELNVANIWYKDESKRFHLKSFKALGGAYAVARYLQEYLAKRDGVKPNMEQILGDQYRKDFQDIVISCATDGNHGRSVAWGCELFGCQCVIYIHRDVSVERQRAMEAFGARVIRITGNYDDSVRQAAEDAVEHNRIIVSDTSYPGYVDIPKDVMAGYTVMLSEAVQQLADEKPTHVFIQGGVGGLAAVVCAYFWQLWGVDRPRFIVVEPVNANCLQQSAEQGTITTVTGDLETYMAGLACGEVSILAWDVLSIGAHDFVTVSEDMVPLTMQLLAAADAGDVSIEAGESAVAGLAALICARQNHQFSEQFGLTENSRVFVIGTEGATDEAMYEKLVNASASIT